MSAIFFLRCQMVPLISWNFLSAVVIEEFWEETRLIKARHERRRPEPLMWNPCAFEIQLWPHAPSLLLLATETFIYTRELPTKLVPSFFLISDILPFEMVLCGTCQRKHFYATFAASSRNPGFARSQPFGTLCIFNSTCETGAIWRNSTASTSHSAIPFCTCWILFYFSTTLQTDHSGIINHVHREWKSEDI